MSFVTTQSVHETKILATKFVGTLCPTKRAVVVALSGDLGSGKTTFVQGCAAALGITDSIQSPTFVIEKRYPLAPPQSFSTLVHIDAYRLDSFRALTPLSFQETCADPKNLIFIEWPERVLEALPKGVQTVSFTFVSPEVRTITFTPPLHHEQ